MIDSSTNEDIQEIVRIGGAVIEKYKDVIYRESFQIAPFRNVIDKLFALGQKYKDERKDVMQMLVKLLMNSLH